MRVIRSSTAPARVRCPVLGPLAPLRVPDRRRRRPARPAPAHAHALVSGRPRRGRDAGCRAEPARTARLRGLLPPRDGRDDDPHAAGVRLGPRRRRRAVARLQADAFCHSMVRALVGACVAVGERRLAAARSPSCGMPAQRTSEFKVMPAKGLTLVEVGYPPDDELGRARAEQTRARSASLAQIAADRLTCTGCLTRGSDPSPPPQGSSASLRNAHRSGIHEHLDRKQSYS